MKKLFIVLTIVAVLVTGITVAFASASKTPADIVSGLTGKTVDQVNDARRNGRTYGAQAADAGKLEEFKNERLEQYKLVLDEAVKDKRITQEKASQLYNAMKQRMDACNGNGTGGGCGLRSTAATGNGCASGFNRSFGRMNGGCRLNNQ